MNLTDATINAIFKNLSNNQIAFIAQKDHGRNSWIEALLKGEVMDTGDEYPREYENLRSCKPTTITDTIILKIKVSKYPSESERDQLRKLFENQESITDEGTLGM